jgi:FK506-binding nuclear protein
VLTIDKAALGPDSYKTGNKTRTIVMLTHQKDGEFALCSLAAEKHDQQSLDVVFMEGETIHLRVIGENSVHLTGYYIDEADDAMAGYDSEELDAELNGEDIENSEHDGCCDDDEDDDDDDDEEDSEMADFIDDEDDISGEDDEDDISGEDDEDDISGEDDEDDISGEDDEGVSGENLDDAKKRLLAKFSRRVREITSDEEEEEESDEDYSEVDTEDDAEVDTEDDAEVDTEDDAEVDTEDDAEVDTEDDDDDDEDSDEEEDLDYDSEKEEENVEDEEIDSDDAGSVDMSPKGRKNGKVPKEAPASKKIKVDENKSVSVNKSVKKVEALVKEGNSQVSPSAKEKSSQLSAPVKEGRPQVSTPAREGANPSPQVSTPVSKTLPSGLKIEDIKVGAGIKAQKGRRIELNYTITNEAGKVISSNQPLAFNLGDAKILKALGIGIQGMALGGERKLVVPSSMIEQGVQPTMPKSGNCTITIKLDKVHTKTN